jgi:ABC-type nitrate/sulfonate/bicarbonate transport system permease component
MKSRTRKTEDRKTQMTLISIFAVVGGFLIWWLIINRWVDHLYWPSISSVINALMQIRKRILLYIGASLYRTILGYIFGCVLGIVAGFAMSWSRYIFALINPYVQIIRPIPQLALIPFYILWFGIGDAGKIIMITVGTFFVMVITTLEAIHQLNRVYIRAATVLGATKWEIYRTIIFPGTIPAIMGGLRVNVALSLGLMIASEFLGAKSGLGYLIIVARRTMATEVMLLTVIIIGFISFFLDRVVLWIGRYVTRWLPE